jgi:hypothetical protein
MISEDPEGALGASEEALCTGAIRIEVGPVDPWLVPRGSWLAGHATRLDDGCGPMLSNTVQYCPGLHIRHRTKPRTTADTPRIGRAV